MQKSLKVESHRERISQMRQTIKASPLMKKTTMPLEAKLERNKLRRKSATLDTPMLDKRLADSESQEERQDLTDFNQRYKMGQKIGEGAHGVVRKCYAKSNQQLFAVKTIVLDQEHILYLKQNFIDIKKLKHPHIIRYHAIFFQQMQQKCHLVMDYLPFRDLLQVKLTSEKELRQIVYQVTSTLAYIHSQKICHRDIKPENILYNQEEKSVILVDFGISKKVTKRGIKRDMLTLTGTPYYRAPQMFEGGGYSELVDMWALGITVYKLMTGVTPFESEYHSDTIENIMKGQLVYPPNIEARFSKQARMFVSLLLKKRKQRPTARQTLNDIWFIDLSKENEDYIRSMTMGKKQMTTLNTNVESSSGIPCFLSRTQTSAQQSQIDQICNTKEERLKKLKSLDDVEEEKSTIFGYGQEASTPTRPFNVFN